MLQSSKLTTGTIPPPVLVLLAVLSIQLGAAFAIDLFSELGPSGAVFSRLAVSVVLLAIAFRPAFGAHIWKHYRLLLAYGGTLALMNWCFYEAIARIPLGLAVTIEFMGPLAVAVLSSRRPIDILWVAISVVGLLILAPDIGENIDTTGVLFAVLAGIGWGGFVLLSKKVSATLPGNSGLVYGMAIAALFMMVFSYESIIPVFFSVELLVSVILLAILSTAVPFYFEFSALKTMSPHTYGVLITLEPVVAAIVGAVFLGDALGVKGMIAVACVTIAAFGATFTQPKQS